MLSSNLSTPILAETPRMPIRPIIADERLLQKQKGHLWEVPFAFSIRRFVYLSKNEIKSSTRFE